MIEKPLIVHNAITLTEPWATLMAIGAKKNETRSKRTHFRGWLAIHAGKAFPINARALCVDYPFADVLGHDAVELMRGSTLGKVLAVVRVIDCVPTHEFLFSVNHPERHFGDYSFGRFAHITDAVYRLKEPMPARGFQSIPWKLPVPITADMLA
ncbi:hypothetical protein UFOVP1670_42 [uncultured Caudovirales phage]|uniref:ASCH domain-containing protein n=1 Tax=uncultured Caudovirales phage TaxID=2100421 RepID=A0A6J5T792_9CAUD|nr:hypothetical protein UFOVP1670_42 [uncultured Caudovirales phage]